MLQGTCGDLSSSASAQSRVSLQQVAQDCVQLWLEYPQMEIPQPLGSLLQCSATCVVQKLFPNT